MSKSKFKQIALCLQLCLLFSIVNSPLTFSESENEYILEDGVFTIGKITNNPRKQYKRLKPMADLIAGKLGLSKGNAVFTKTIADMQKRIESGEVDLFTGSAYEAALLLQSGAGQPLVLKSKEQARYYHSIIATHIDEQIDSIEQLGGKTIAFEDSSSTSAFRVPQIEIQQAGFKLAESHLKPTEKGIVHYRFSGSEQNSSALLFQKSVDAIALSDTDWNKVENVPEFQKSQFKIIHTSPAIPRALEVVRSSLSQETKNSLLQILLNLHRDDSTESVMMAYHKTTEFTPVSEDTLQQLNRLGNYFED